MWRNHNTQGYTDSVMAMAPENAPSRIFYGWWVALALSIIVFLSAGIRFTIGPFLKPISADLGLDRGSFSLVIALSLGLAATGDVMGSVTLANWFVKRRGVAMSFLGSASMAGSSLGTWLGGFLFDVTGSYGAAFGVAGALLLIAAILSLSIDEKARPACRAVPIPSRPLPVAGGS